MASLIFRRHTMTPSEIQRELLHYGNNNIANLKKYHLLVPMPLENERGDNRKNTRYKLDASKALTLQQRIEDHEKRNWLQRLWYWTFTDIANAQSVYYFSAAWIATQSLKNNQSLSQNQYHLINNGVNQNNRLSRLGTIYRALETQTQRTMAIRPDPRSFPFAHILFSMNRGNKPQTIASKILGWFGFGKPTPKLSPFTASILNAYDANNSAGNPIIVMHNTFEKDFSLYKNSLLKLSEFINNLYGQMEYITEKQLTQAQMQLDNIKKMERKLMMLVHPDKNIDTTHTIAEINFKRLVMYADWKSKSLEETIVSVKQHGRFIANDIKTVFLMSAKLKKINETDDKHRTEIEVFIATGAKRAEQEKPPVEVRQHDSAFNEEMEDNESEQRKYKAEQKETQDLKEMLATLLDDIKTLIVQKQEELSRVITTLSLENIENKEQLLKEKQSLEEDIISLSQRQETGHKGMERLQALSLQKNPGPSNNEKKPATSTAQNPYNLFNGNISADPSLAEAPSEIDQGITPSALQM